MSRKIYLNGEAFKTIEGALAYLAMRWGKRLTSRRLRLLADAEGGIGVGTGAPVRVSWKAPDAENGGAGEEGAGSGERGRPAPLLRYPPGEGPQYQWSRRWR
jgi:hypothetical protein